MHKRTAHPDNLPKRTCAEHTARIRFHGAAHQERYCNHSTDGRSFYKARKGRKAFYGAYTLGLVVLGPLMGCVGQAPPTLTELEAPLLAHLWSVQRLLGHGLSCSALPFGLHAVHHRVVLQRRKLSKGEGGPSLHASPGTVQQCLTDPWSICGSKLEDSEGGKTGGGDVLQQHQGHRRLMVCISNNSCRKVGWWNLPFVKLLLAATGHHAVGRTVVGRGEGQSIYRISMVRG